MGMAIKKPVIVMALYDIGRDNWSSFTMSYNTYLAWMKNTLSLNAPVVVYTEDRFKDQIIKMRKEFDPDMSQTEIIVTPLGDLECYKLYHKRLSDLMLSKEFDKKINVRVPEMDRPLYNVIMFNKVFFIKDAKKFFDGDLYIWADAGGLRENLSNYQGQNWPCLSKINELDNSKVTFFSHSKNIIVKDKEYHALSQIRYIQGTAFFVPASCVDELLEDFNKTIQESLDDNYIGSDEKIFDIMYCKDRDKYNIIKCDWRAYFDIFKENGLAFFDKNGNQANAIFLDLGAHELQGLRRFIDKLDMDRSWEIHAFEPNPAVNVQEFADELNHYRIFIHRKAIWKRTGRAILNQYGKDGTSQGSLLEETNGGKEYGDFYGEKIIDCIDLLEFIKKLDIHKDIFIKMDIEWAEYEVLNRMLSDWPKNVKKIWIDWHGLSDDKNMSRAKDLISKIKSLGTEIDSLNSKMENI
jgi:FkbM family methyltransferase